MFTSMTGPLDVGPSIYAGALVSHGQWNRVGTGEHPYGFLCGSKGLFPFAERSHKHGWRPQRACLF